MHEVSATLRESNALCRGQRGQRGRHRVGIPTADWTRRKPPRRRRELPCQTLLPSNLIRTNVGTKLPGILLYYSSYRLPNFSLTI